jgi:hypothetical protein
LKTRVTESKPANGYLRWLRGLEARATVYGDRS